MSTTTNRFELPLRRLAIPLGAIAVGAVVVLAGLIWDAERAWPNLLLDGYYITMLGLAGVFFLATQRLTGARWSTGLRRVPEAVMAGLPIAAVLLLAVFVFGRHTLYGWSHPGAFAHEPAIAGKVQYLQVPLVGTRIVASFVIWTLFAWLFRRWSLAQDAAAVGGIRQHDSLNRLSVFFVLIFALTFTTGAYDWIISLEPHWFSTMFAVLMFAGTFVSGIAAVTLTVVLLWERGHLRDVVGEKQFHDLGKMLFAFSTFWAYIWTCQYLLIWYSNIPEEVTHFISRTNGRWGYVFALNFIINWLVPFAVLLSARAKVKPRVLKWVSILLLFGHWLDLYLAIMPALWKEPRFGVIEIGAAIGYGGLAIVLVARALGRAPLVPTNDPVQRGEDLLHAHSHGHLHAVAHQPSGGERS